MQAANGHSLLDALDISIRRISNFFDLHWLHMGSERIDGNYIHKHIDPVKEDNDYIIKPNEHSFTEICMCVTGSLTFKIGEHYIELKEGYACFILPGLSHCEIPMESKDYLALWLAIDTTKARLHLSGSKEFEFFTTDLYFLNCCDEYNFNLDRVKIESRDHGDKAYEMIKACLIQMYIIALREISTDKSSKQGNMSWKESVCSEIKEYINNSGFSHLKLRDISHEICISENHMNSIFKSVTGLTIAQYIEHQKLAKTKNLLSDSTMTINEISSQLGYYDRYHFSKVFKKATGYSPGQYRNTKSKDIGSL